MKGKKQNFETSIFLKINIISVEDTEVVGVKGSI